MTILVIGSVRLPPENIDRARAAMETMVAASRAEDGCFECAYSQDLIDPGLVRLIAVWRDREVLAAHFNTPHIAAWRAASADLKITDRKLALYEAGQPEPI